MKTKLVAGPRPRTVAAVPASPRPAAARRRRRRRPALGREVADRPDRPQPDRQGLLKKARPD